MKHYLNTRLSLIFSLMLTACGGGSVSEESVPIVQAKENIVCSAKCTSVTSKLNQHVSEQFDAPFENFSQQNATIYVDIFQQGRNKNYVFSTTTENASDSNAIIQSSQTEIIFGYDGFPEADAFYSLVNPALIYASTNNRVPYIWSISFSLLTNDGSYFEGSVRTGDMPAARVIVPDVYSGDIISNFQFRLLNVGVRNNAATITYQMRFDFTRDGTTHHFEQTVYVQNDDLLAVNLPAG